MRSSALAGLLLALCIFFIPIVVAGVGFSFQLGQNAVGLMVVLATWLCIALGGGVAVLFYRRRRPDSRITPGMGARLGVVAGLLGFVFYGLPQAIRLVFFHLGDSIRDAMRKAVEQSAAQSPDPKAAQELMNNLLSPGYLSAFLTFLVVLFFLLFLVFSSLGGAIAASAWGNKEPS